MPFTYGVNVYSDMLLSKGHLGSGGGAFKNKLKYNSFIFPITNVSILGVFRTHARMGVESAHFHVRMHGWE